MGRTSLSWFGDQHFDPVQIGLSVSLFSALDMTSDLEQSFNIHQEGHKRSLQYAGHLGKQHFLALSESENRVCHHFPSLVRHIFDQIWIAPSSSRRSEGVTLEYWSPGKTLQHGQSPKKGTLLLSRFGDAHFDMIIICLVGQKTSGKFMTKISQNSWPKRCQAKFWGKTFQNLKRNWDDKVAKIQDENLGQKRRERKFGRKRCKNSGQKRRENSGQKRRENSGQKRREIWGENKSSGTFQKFQVAFVLAAKFCVMRKMTC